jgi:hypothetical protein
MFSEDEFLYFRGGCYFLLKNVKPSIPVIMTSIRNIKNITFAIEAAPEAISVKPRSAATNAIPKKNRCPF